MALYYTLFHNTLSSDGALGVGGVELNRRLPSSTIGLVNELRSVRCCGSVSPDLTEFEFFLLLWRDR